MAASQVKVERKGRVMIVRLDNPPRNFMTTAMVRELDRLTRELEKDRSIGAVVITGAPDGVFITHFDVAEISAGHEAGRRRPSRRRRPAADCERSERWSACPAHVPRSSAPPSPAWSRCETSTSCSCA